MACGWAGKRKEKNKEEVGHVGQRERRELLSWGLGLATLEREK